MLGAQKLPLRPKAFEVMYASGEIPSSSFMLGAQKLPLRPNAFEVMYASGEIPSSSY